MSVNKRYFEKMDDEGAYYIFDGNTVSESDFEKNFEADDYKAFADSMSGNEIVDRLNELEIENNVLKDKELNFCELFDEIGELNKIYNKKGFKGLIQHIENELEYGRVSFKNGLYGISTAGWSDDEHLIHKLIFPTCRMYRHYCGRKVGGVYYFSENKDVQVEMVVIDG